MFAKVRALFVPAAPGPDAHAVSTFLYLRILGGISLLAFLSLWTQIHGLVGSRGILPVQDLLTFLGERASAERYWQLPTLCWTSGSDTALHVFCGLGVVASLLVLLGFVPFVGLTAIWVLYLSLTTVCQDFLAFQWDNLLLECVFVGILLAPFEVRHRLADARPPVRLSRALGLWLLFRLMFSSGVVKLSSGDPTWRSLEALRVHYETQPLPTWVGWWAHQLPARFQTFSAAALFAIELGAPFLVFGPRRARQLAFVLFVGLQTAIALTGNYAFFNLLSIALALPLLADRDFPRRMTPGPEARPKRHVPAWLLAPAAALILLIGSMELTSAFRAFPAWPAPARWLARLASPFRTVNGYGLFAVITTTRPEIVIEGSDDAATWRPYEFRWKPGDLGRRPAFVAPHQPRLDWQMWFAALGSARQNPWFFQLLRRLLEGSPEVLGLLERNPFPAKPPRYVRAVLYEYHFTDRATRAATGTWWRREPAGLYCPEVSLKE